MYILINIDINTNSKEAQIYMKKILRKNLLLLLISFIIGMTCFIFGTTLILMSNLAIFLFPYNLILLPIVGVLTIAFKNGFRKKLENSMQKVFKSTKINTKLSLSIIPFQMIATWLSHLSGASVGREGVALQIGATISNNFASILNLDKKLLTASGKAAGFSALFGTPLAGLFFVYEFNQNQLKNFDFWYTTIFMVYLSNFFSTLLGLEHFHNHIQISLAINSSTLLKLIIASLIFVIIGNLFVLLLKLQKKYYSKILPNEYFKVLLLSSIYAVIMIIVHGKYMSLGLNLIDSSFTNPDLITSYDFFFKLLFTTFIISLGYQGGEVTPLFAIGSSLGVLIAKLFNLPVTLLAALGYSCVFASATNAYLAGFFIAIEIFGIHILPFALITITVCHLFKNKNGIYEYN